MKTSSRRSSHSSSNKLHPREVMLIRQLLVWGWNDERIWREYRIPIPIIQRAKNVIERQAMEEFENKEMLAFELVKCKDRLKQVIDCNDSISKDENLPYTIRLNSERIKVDAIGKLQDVIEASITSSDPSTALDKIAEQSSGCCRRLGCGNQ